MAMQYGVGTGVFHRRTLSGTFPQPPQDGLLPGQAAGQYRVTMIAEAPASSTDRAAGR